MLGLRADRTMARYRGLGAGALGLGWGEAMRALVTNGYAQPQTARSVVAYPEDWSVMGIPAAWRCATLVADSIANLPMFGYEPSDDGTQARLEPTPTLLEDPWPLITYHNWHFGAVWSLLLRGNAYALPTDPDPANGYPRQLVLLNPDEVWVDLVDGLPRYSVGDMELGPSDIFHVRGVAPPGSPIGIGVIEAHRKGWSTMLALQGYAFDAFQNSGMPSGVITVDRPDLGQQQAADLKRRWMEAFAGKREPAVVPRSITFQPLSFSPEDMAYVEAKKLSATEVCWIFGVHPMMIGAPAGTSLTYGNVESVHAAFATDSLMGWTSRIEQALTKWQPRTVTARYNFDAFLRGTTMERMQSHQIALTIGVETLNEARDREHLPRFGVWADEPFATGPPGSESDTAPPELGQIGPPGRSSAAPSPDPLPQLAVIQGGQP